MKTYTQDEDGHLVPDDGGAIWRKSEIFQMFFPVTDLVRTATDAEPDPRRETEPLDRRHRNINGKVNLAAFRYLSIDMFQDGKLVPYRGPVNIHIGDSSNRLKDEEPGIGWALSPNVVDPQDYDSELLLSVRLSDERFEWLWRQIGDLKSANLGISLRMRAWQTSADAAFGPENDHYSFALIGRDRKAGWDHGYSPIYSAQITISDQKPSKPSDPLPVVDRYEPVEPPQPIIPRDGAGWPKEIQNALWVIMALLAVLIVVIWNRTG